MRYVVAIDQGTTGTTVVVLSEQLDVVGRATQKFRQIMVGSGATAPGRSRTPCTIISGLGAYPSVDELRTTPRETRQDEVPQQRARACAQHGG